MLYVIQENVFRNENYDKIFQAIDKLKLPNEIIKIEKDGNLSNKITVKIDLVGERLNIRWDCENESYHEKGMNLNLFGEIFTELLIEQRDNKINDILN